MKRLLKEYAGGFVGKKSRAHSSALVGHPTIGRCALVAVADVDQEYHLVHVFEVDAAQVSGGADFDEATEFRLYSWNGLEEFLNTLADPGEEYEKLFLAERRACSHRPDIRDPQATRFFSRRF